MRHSGAKVILGFIKEQRTLLKLAQEYPLTSGQVGFRKEEALLQSIVVDLA